MCPVIKKQSCAIKRLVAEPYTRAFFFCSKILEGRSRSASRFPLYISDFCVTPQRLKAHITWKQKSQQFLQKTLSVIIWHLRYSFPQKASSSLGSTHRSEAYPHCKNAVTNPFSRDPKRLPKNVLFTTVRLEQEARCFSTALRGKWFSHERWHAIRCMCFLGR